jgi:nucleoside-diphosphate kinase
MNQLTLLLIKPNATKRNLIGKILQIIEENRFRIVDLKLINMTDEIAGKFYAVHKEKAFYEKLCDFMTSGSTIAVILDKENAVNDLRTLVGNTDPDKANPGTIRYLYGESLTINAVHASDSPENAENEIKIIFCKE